MEKSKLLAKAVVAAIIPASLMTSGLDGMLRVAVMAAILIIPFIVFIFCVKNPREYLDTLFPTLVSKISLAIVLLNAFIIFSSAHFFIEYKAYAAFLADTNTFLGLDGLFCTYAMSPHTSIGLDCTFFDFHQSLTVALCVTAGLYLTIHFNRFWPEYRLWLSGSGNNFAIYSKLVIALIGASFFYYLVAFLGIEKYEKFGSIDLTAFVLSSGGFFLAPLVTFVLILARGLIGLFARGATLLIRATN